MMPLLGSYDVSLVVRKQNTASFVGSLEKTRPYTDWCKNWA
jgi:hypothetical protein